MTRKGRKLTEVHHGGSGEAAEPQSCWGIGPWGMGWEGQWRRQLLGTPAEKVSHDCTLTPHAGAEALPPTPTPTPLGTPPAGGKALGAPGVPLGCQETALCQFLIISSAFSFYFPQLKRKRLRQLWSWDSLELRCINL